MPPRLLISELRQSAPLYFWGEAHEVFVCFLKKSGRWCFAAVATTGSLLGSRRKLTVNPRPKIKMLIAAPPHVNSFLARFRPGKK